MLTTLLIFTEVSGGGSGGVQIKHMLPDCRLMLIFMESFAPSLKQPSSYAVVD